MRRAAYLVNRLLEAEQIPAPAQDMPKGSILAIQHDTPEISPNFDDFFERLDRYGYGKGPEGLQKFLDDGGAYFVRDASGKIRLYSQNLPLVISPRTLMFSVDSFGVDLMDDNLMAYSKGPGQPILQRKFSQIFQSHKKQMKGQGGQGGKGKEKPQYEIGFTSNRRTTGGLLVLSVIPNSSAAKAGLKKDDVVFGIKGFTDSKGDSHPAVLLQKNDHIKWILARYTPGTVLPLRIKREGQNMVIPVVPEESKADSSQAEKSAPEPKELIQPNEPEPASKTGFKPI